MVKAIIGRPYDAIVMSKANLEAALDIAGVGACATAGHAQETWQSNIRFRPGEFNLIKSLAQKGVNGAIREREDFYSGAPLRRK